MTRKGPIMMAVALLLGAGITQALLGVSVRSAAAADLFARLSTRGFAFDVELLLLARAAGYRIAEAAVNWTDQPGSKVGVLKDGPGMLWQILRARRRIVRRS